VETGWLIKEMSDELDAWGYRGEELILTSDQEPAIESVKKRLAEYRGGKTMLERNGCRRGCGRW
jgi:hypothetical protein